MTLPQQRAGWGMLWGAALAASFSPPVCQLLFAVIAIGVIGMAHGASDLAIVRPERQPLFLIGYGVAMVLCLIWWHISPALALPGFLLASALHFALEDAPDGSLPERLARGISLIATPATLHAAGWRTILQSAGLDAAALDALTTAMALAGGATAAALLIVGVTQRNWRLIAGTLALLLLPPFVGFSMGFLILHALPQTAQRRERLGCTGYMAYLRATWPVLLSALALAAITVCMMQPGDTQGIRSLFAALAALAIPHLLITPWFETQATDH